MNHLIKSIAIILACIMLFSCKKEEVPVVTTTAISNISGTSATSGGTITSEGTEDVIARGICWSTATNPTIADSKTSDGEGPGNFPSNMSGLNGATMYYVRAYATNIIGTGYGMVISFTSLGETPASSVAEASNITNTGATLNGSVNSNYLSTEVTFEYGTTTSYGLLAAANQSPLNGSVSVPVTSDITGLEIGTTYHFRVKAINSLGTAYSDDMTFSTSGVKDYDGNIYNTIKIGSKTWMAENLRTTHYNDGSAITYVTSNILWPSASEGGYCAFNNYAPNLVVYGALYNWHAVNTGKLCPVGWHSPIDTDWIALTEYLGGAPVAGGKMKESGLDHWISPNTGASNSSGFTALGAAFIDYKGVFGVLKQNAYYWSSTEVTPGYAFGNKLFYDNSSISQGGGTNMLSGFSIRCIKD